MNKILYFGYGANRDPEMMRMILGHDIAPGKHVVLKGYEIGVQRLDQAPNTLRPGSDLPASPQEILKEVWDEDFTTYVIRPAEDKEVHGILWELTKEERELIQEWEIVGDWYKQQEIKVITDDGLEIDAETEIMGDGQDLDHLVDGKDYPNFLNPIEGFAIAAESSRRGYYERKVRMEEGAIVTPESQKV